MVVAMCTHVCGDLVEGKCRKGLILRVGLPRQPTTEVGTVLGWVSWSDLCLMGQNLVGGLSQLSMLANPGMSTIFSFSMVVHLLPPSPPSPPAMSRRVGGGAGLEV